LLQGLKPDGCRPIHAGAKSPGLLKRSAGDALLLGDDLSSEKKKRERAPAVKAQILTGLMIAEGLR